MAQKRMFSKQIVSSDAFLDMPASSQLLYFHLNMEADDDGFVSSPKKIMKILGSGDDDFKVLLGKRFILPFESGVVVIKHWLIHNYIRNDTYRETKYLAEKKSLIIKENKSYSESRRRSVDAPSTQYSIDKISIDKISKERGASPLPILEVNQSIIDKLVEKGFNPAFVELEIKKFLSYWTEPSRSGKQRWEGEKYFDVSRRIATWFGRANSYNQPQQKNIITSV